MDGKLLERSLRALFLADPAERSHARELYELYCMATDFKSAISGAKLPDFDLCPAVVQAAWLAVSLGTKHPPAEARRRARGEWNQHEQNRIDEQERLDAL